MERKEVRGTCTANGGFSLTGDRIFEKNHLLDATEIFRKLNVHKKVSFAEQLQDSISRRSI
jgi:hypothetical protein